MSKHRYSPERRHTQSTPFELASLNDDLMQVMVGSIRATKQRHEYIPGRPSPSFLRVMLRERNWNQPFEVPTTASPKEILELFDKLQARPYETFERQRHGAQNFGWVFSDMSPTPELTVDGKLFNTQDEYSSQAAALINHRLTPLTDAGIHAHAYNQDRITWIHFRGEMSHFLDVAAAAGSYAVSGHTELY